MTGLVVALCASAGTYYLYTALVLGWQGVRRGAPPARPARPRRRASEWLVQAGIGEVSVREFAVVSAGLALLGGVGGVALFGGPLPALVLALCLGAAPLGSYRVRRLRLRATAQEAWPPAPARRCRVRDAARGPRGGWQRPRPPAGGVDRGPGDRRPGTQGRQKQAGGRAVRPALRAAGPAGDGVGGHVGRQRPGGLRHAVGPDVGGDGHRLGGGVLGLGGPAVEVARRATGLLRVNADFADNGTRADTRGRAACSRRSRRSSAAGFEVAW